MHAVQMIDRLIARQALPDKRKKDFITSVRKLAAALDVAPEDLDLATIAHTYADTLTTYFANLVPAASVHTQRNTLQNLVQIYRAAHETHLLRKPAPVKAKRITYIQAREQSSRSAHYRARSAVVLGRYIVPGSEWPTDILEHWEAYLTEKQFEVRDATIKKYDDIFQAYVSYNLQFDQSPPTTWGQLFEVARLRRWIQWHAARVDAGWKKDMGTAPPHKTRITQRGLDAVHVIVMLARYLKHPDAEALIAFRSKLPVVERWHRKTDAIHTVTFRELEDLGLQLLADARRPMTWIHPATERVGRNRAIACQNGLLIRLWWRIPIRSRSMRELDIALPGVTGHQPRLYQDQQGIWQLHYRGEQLKVGERRGRQNEFRVPFPPDVVPHLEEYLRDFRPILPNADRHPHLFLSSWGNPLSTDAIRNRLVYTTFKHLGKLVYPHLLRTLWTDAYLLSSGGDIDTAAYMLNDNVATVLKHYHEIRGDEQIIKAYAFNQAILGLGNGKGTSR